MNSNFFVTVARRFVQFSNAPQILSFSPRYIAACLFQLAKLNGDLSVESVNLWLKAANGKLSGVSQLRLIDHCREFKTTFPKAFTGIFSRKPDDIYDAVSEIIERGDNSLEAGILKWTLFMLAGEIFDTSGSVSLGETLKKSNAEEFLADSEWRQIQYLVNDFKKCFDAVAAQNLFEPLPGKMKNNFSINVEVIV